MRVLRWLPALAVVAAAVSCAPQQDALDRQPDLVRLELRRGQLDEGLARARQGMKEAEAAGDLVLAWRFRLLAAEALTAKPDLSAALDLLQAEVPGDGAFAAVRVRRQYQLAYIYVAQGRLKEAIPLIDEALPAAAGDPDLRLDLELLQAQVLYRTGRAPHADTLLAEARDRVGGEGDAYREAQLAITTGMGLVTRGRFDEAVPHFNRILELPGVEDTTIHGRALYDAGLCYARLGQFERAVALQQQAVSELKGRGQRDYAQAMGELGNTYLLQDDIARGAEYLQQAFDIAAASELRSDAALWARNLAAAYVALRRWDEAARFNAEAARFAAPGSRSPYATVTAAQVAAGRGQAQDAGRLFQEALAAGDATPGVRWMSHNGLALLAAAAGRTGEAARQFEAALQTVEQTRSALLRADYRISFTSRLIDFYRGYTEFLLALGETKRALEVADSSRARVLAERQNVAAPETRAEAAALQRLARDTRATLLFYALGPEQSWVWAVTAGGVHLASLPPAPEIEPLVTAHQAAVQNALADPLAAGAGRRLYDVLVGPVATYAPRGSRLIVVPDGALHRLNFETLAVPGETPHYWIEDVTIQIAPSLSMLQGPGLSAGALAKAEVRGQGSGIRDPESADRRSLLLVGNPTPRAPEFPALSYAAAEMERIAKHFPSQAVTTVAGPRASPAAFRAAGPERFSVIHFTSHAVANVESPLDSAVILSGPDEAYKLYAREVAQMPLATDLVTVSACRSAGDRAYAGEGLVGFAWAFLRAGAQRVVAGLWDVDDRSTALLMDGLYARLATGDRPADALREAKLALISAGFPRPFYWAPFQVFTVVP